MSLITVILEAYKAEDWISGALGVSEVQGRILKMLFFEGALGVTRLCQCTGLSLPNGSREVRHLEALGLVKKEPGSLDKRQVTVRLSEHGEARMKEFLKSSRQEFEKVFKNWAPQDQQDFQRALEDFLPWIQRLNGFAGPSQPRKVPS